MKFPRHLWRAAAAALLCALPFAVAAQQTGAQVYAQRCAGCHMVDGSGKPTAFPPLKNLSGWLATAEGRMYVTHAILYGPFGEVVVGGQRYAGMMPRYGPRLSNAEIVAVIGYLGETLNAPLPGYVRVDESVVLAARALPDKMQAVSEERSRLPPR